MAGMIRIGKHEWSVKRGEVSCCVLPVSEADSSWGRGTNGLGWFFEIKAESMLIGRHSSGPYIYHQAFPALVKTWRGLESLSFPFTPPSASDDREVPRICIGEHDDLENAAFAFGKREGSRFQFHLTGEYLWFEMEPDPVTVDIWLNFTGVATYSSSAEKAWNLVTQHLDPRHLRMESDPPIERTRGRIRYHFRPIEDE